MDELFQGCHFNGDVIFFPWGHDDRVLSEALHAGKPSGATKV